MPKLTFVAVHLVLWLLCTLSFYASSQEGVKDSVATVLPLNLYSSLSEKALAVENRMDKAFEKYLHKLLKQELKLRGKIAKIDSFKAQALFADLEKKYTALQEAPPKLSKYASVYSGHLDSLTTSLNFLKSTGVANPELQNALARFSSLQQKLDQSEAIKKFLTERKRLLKENLERLGMLKDLKGFNKEAYYYSARLKELKAAWQDPSGLEKKLLAYVMKSEKFKDFFRNNSGLASLFALPGGNNPTASLAGLQTRASVQQAITARFGSGPGVQQMLQQNLQAAQGQLSELKDKLSQYGTGSFGNSTGDIEVPEGFTPNGQRTKPFLQRLEYGANVQSQKARSYFPATSDLGLSLGYKLNDQSSIGLGASYKVGWGRGWDHLRVTSEGVGLRSYLDYKLKGSLYIAGGYEQNYRTAFQHIEQLRDYSGWQSSGLIGLSKKYKVSKKVKGDMKLLWDFLSYQQVPRTQAILFRIGYSLK